MFLNKLLGMLGEVSLNNVLSPATELERGDKVVGILPDDLKKLYWVAEFTEHKFATLGTETSKKFGNLSKEELEKQKDAVTKGYENILVASKEFDATINLFWSSVRLQFPSTIRAMNIGLRKDWQVVTVDPRETAKREFGTLLDELYELLDELLDPSK